LSGLRSVAKFSYFCSIARCLVVYVKAMGRRFQPGCSPGPLQCLSILEPFPFSWLLVAHSRHSGFRIQSPRGRLSCFSLGWISICSPKVTRPHTKCIQQFFGDTADEHNLIRARIDFAFNNVDGAISVLLGHQIGGRDLPCARRRCRYLDQTAESHSCRCCAP